LDKRLVTFWKFCRKKKQRPQGNWLDSSCSKLDKRDIFIDCQRPRYTILLQDQTCISLNSLSITMKIKNNESATWLIWRNIDLALNKQESKNVCVLLWIRTFDHGVLGHL
jgi:hypothetical protein